jgi:hypothetical protein
MSKPRCHILISLDGFVAGPNQSEENPLGEGGELTSISSLQAVHFPLKRRRPCLKCS